MAGRLTRLDSAGSKWQSYGLEPTSRSLKVIMRRRNSQAVELGEGEMDNPQQSVPLIGART